MFPWYIKNLFQHPCKLIVHPEYSSSFVDGFVASASIHSLAAFLFSYQILTVVVISARPVLPQVPEYAYPKDSVPEYLSILVPNVDNVRTDFLIETIAKQGKAVLLVGEQVESCLHVIHRSGHYIYYHRRLYCIIYSTKQELLTQSPSPHYK